MSFDPALDRPMGRLVQSAEGGDQRRVEPTALAVLALAASDDLVKAGVDGQEEPLGPLHHLLTCPAGESSRHDGRRADVGGARAERGERALGERGVKRTFRGTCSFVNSSTQRCVCSFGSSTHCQETREGVGAWQGCEEGPARAPGHRGPALP